MKKLLKNLIIFVAIASIAFPASLSLTWKDNSNNETGFIIERTNGVATAQSVWIEIARTAANATSYVDEGLPNATTFSYRVASFNSGGKSTYTSVASETTVPLPPAAPSDLKLEAVKP